MKRAVLLAVAIAVACVPVASASAKTNTTVTIDSVFLGAGDTQWAGDIMSPRKACKNKRLVLIFRARPGTDVKVGSTRSFKGMVDNGYYWTFSKAGAAKRGRYYAKVKPTDTCEGDRSGTLTGP
jgi:hypothetical protein